MRPKTRIGLILNTATVYGTQVVAGIVQAAREHNEWTIQPMFLSEEGLAELLAWKPQGIIGRMECDTMLRPVLRLRVPIVDINGWEYRPRIQAVLTDDVEVGRRAARHFLDRRYQNIAFCGIADRRYSNERQAGLREALVESGLSADHCHHLPLNWSSAGVSRRRGGKSAGPARLEAWLRGLPKPVAILCCEDLVAAQVCERCAAAGLIVPEEVAILGVGNDEALCGLAETALSSIPLPARELGYAAGRCLERLMKGDKPGQPERIAPHPLIVRQSTDTSAVNDPVIRRALQYIRDHAHKPFGVEDILDALQLSRRAFELRFRSAMGRTPREEIEAARINRACNLLVETDSDVGGIARLCGFGSAEWFTLIFRRKHGLSPTRYRSAFRRRNAPPATTA